MSTKRSPQDQQQYDKALKHIDDFFGGRLPKETRTPEQIKADREARNQKSIADRQARYEKEMAGSRARDKANLPSLEKRLAELDDIAKKGKGWHYEVERTMSPEQIKARDTWREFDNLIRRVNYAKQGDSYSKGGKINLKDCRVSTHEKKSKSKNCW